MKKLLTLFFALILVVYAYGQTKVSTAYKGKVTCSQKYGITAMDGDFLLTVVYDDNQLSFNTSEGQTMTNYEVKKKTDKYVIGADPSGNYAFYDIGKKQFYYIDYFMNRYTTAGNGPGYSELKQTVTKMMDMLKSGSTQKDVIKHLVDQAEMDF